MVERLKPRNISCQVSIWKTLIPVVMILCLFIHVESFFGSTSPYAALSQCREMIAEGKGTKTLKTLKKLASSKDRNISRPAAYLITEVYLSQNPPQQRRTCQKILQKLAESSIHDSWRIKAAVKLSSLWRGTLQEEGAIALLEDILSEDSFTVAHIEAAEALGNLYLSKESWDDAIRCYEFALALKSSLGSRAYDFDMSAINANLELARLHGGLGEPESTFERAEKHRLSNQYNEAIPLYRSIIKEYPDHDLADHSGFLIGACLLAQNKLRMAEKQWGKFIAEEPSGPYRAKAHIGLGDLYLERYFNPEQAEGVYSAAKKIIDEDDNILPAGWYNNDFQFDLYIRLGLIYYLAGDKKQAKSHFGNAAIYQKVTSFNSQTLRPLPTPTERMITACMSEEGPVPKSALASDKKKAGLILLLGRMAFLSEDYERASDLFARITNKSVSASKNQRAYALYQTGMTYYRMWDYPTAVATYEECLLKHPRNPWEQEVLIWIGILHYSGMQESEKARKYFKTLAKRYPKAQQGMQAMYYIGVTYYWDREYQKAYKAFSSFMKHYPNNPWKERLLQKTLPDIGEHLAREERES